MSRIELEFRPTQIKLIYVNLLFTFSALDFTCSVTRKGELIQTGILIPAELSSM